MLGPPIHMTLSPLLGVVLAAVPGLGYVQATDWYEHASNPAHFQPLQLVDGNLRTGWCSASGDAQADALGFGVAAMVTVDEVRIATGNQADSAAFHASARPRKFVLRTDGRASTFSVADTEGIQSVKLDAPLQGQVFILEVLDVEPAEDPAAPACLSEVQLVSHGKPVPHPKKSLLRFSPERARLVGTWYAGDEGNPDQSLSFFLDGTWQQRTVVYDAPTRPKTVNGTWGLDKKGLWMKAPGSGKGRVTPALETRADAHGKGRTTLTLKGGVPAALRVPFRDRR
ncbi:MAG TPA: hypothetical protein VFE93_03810 [Myxococcaceae bacterium]|nr:hypothetical protein [Myxococcaceae bacterium]